MQFYDATSFWGRVKERAAANGMSMKALADRAGLNYATMTNQIGQQVVPKKAGVIDSIAKELGCTVEYLTTGKNSIISKYSPEIEHLIFEYKLLDQKKKDVLLAVLEALTAKQAEEYEEYKQKHPELFRT